MKKILVVGGFGFLGSTLVSQLFETNKYDITILVKKSSNAFRINKNILKKIKVAYIENINFDSFFKQNKFYSVVNLAVIYDDIFDYKVFETNFILTLKIIEYAKINLCENFITFGSFFSKFKNYDQKVAYTSSKKNLSDHLKSISKARVLNLQLEHMYGPFDSESKFIPQIAKHIYENNKEIKLTKGTQKRDFIFVKDVCDLTLEILEKFNYFDFGFSTIEVGNGKSIEVKEFIEKMKYIFKNDITKLRFGTHPENINEIKESKANLDLIPSFMSWKPKTSISEGIIEILKNIKKK